MSIFIPNKQNISTMAMNNWYNNVNSELNEIKYTEIEKRYIKAYYKEAGLLSKWKYNYFVRHFCCNFVKAINYTLNDEKNQRIIDLGGGIGTQGLFMAHLDIDVVVIDGDEIAIDILNKRIEYYKKLSPNIRIRGICSNTLTYDYNQLKPFHGVYSMFAFNMMQPTTTLLENIIDSMERNNKIIIQDGNSSSWLGKIRKRNVLSPTSISKLLINKGYNVKIEGCISLPPVVWWFNNNYITKLDERLSVSQKMAISYQLFAVK